MVPSGLTPLFRPLTGWRRCNAVGLNWRGSLAGHDGGTCIVGPGYLSLVYPRDVCRNPRAPGHGPAQCAGSGEGHLSLPAFPCSTSAISRVEERTAADQGQGSRLSPAAGARPESSSKVVIADGYHRLCSVYAFDEDSVIPCQDRLIRDFAPAPSATYLTGRRCPRMARGRSVVPAPARTNPQVQRPPRPAPKEPAGKPLNVKRALQVSTFASVVLLTACVPAWRHPVPRADATLEPRSGQQRQRHGQLHESAAKVVKRVAGLTPGEHGFHIHRSGDLQRTGRNEAQQGHFSPARQSLAQAHQRLTDRHADVPTSSLTRAARPNLTKPTSDMLSLSRGPAGSRAAK